MMDTPNPRPLILRAGGIYRTREDGRATVTMVNAGSDWPVQGWLISVRTGVSMDAEWLRDGRYFLRGEYAYDLVEEITNG